MSRTLRERFSCVFSFVEPSYQSLGSVWFNQPCHSAMFHCGWRQSYVCFMVREGNLTKHGIFVDHLSQKQNKKTFESIQNMTSISTILSIRIRTEFKIMFRSMRTLNIIYAEITMTQQWKPGTWFFNNSKFVLVKYLHVIFFHVLYIINSTEAFPTYIIVLHIYISKYTKYRSLLLLLVLLLLLLLLLRPSDAYMRQ